MFLRLSVISPPLMEIYFLSNTFLFTQQIWSPHCVPGIVPNSVNRDV